MTRSERILVVEDDPDIREMVALVLSTVGFNVEAAYDANQAIEMWRLQAKIKRPYHLVLTDLHMPHMDGVAMIATLEAEAQYPLLALLMTSDRDPPVAWVTAQRPFIRKPFDPDTLVALIRSLMTRSHTPPHPSPPPSAPPPA